MRHAVRAVVAMTSLFAGCGDDRSTLGPSASVTTRPGAVAEGERSFGTPPLATTAGFSGVRTHVPIASLPGWTVCHSESYATSGTAVSVLLGACGGGRLMLACRATGSPIQRVAAQAGREDVLTPTSGNATHTANGVAWYFGADLSWGFAPEGASVNRSSCDTQDLLAPAGDSDKRLCWHQSGGSLSGGWRCGDQVGLNGSSAWERVVLTAE
jgi:hypothetical protein